MFFFKSKSNTMASIGRSFYSLKAKKAIVVPITLQSAALTSVTKRGTGKETKRKLGGTLLVYKDKRA